MKIFYLTELLSPYRIEWMNLLCAQNTVTAYCIRFSERTREQRWLDSQKPLFAVKEVQRSRFTDRLPSGDYLRSICEAAYDIYLIDGYSSPIKRKVIRTLLKRKKRVYINIDGIDVWRARTAADILKDRVKRRVYRSGAHFLCGSHIAADTVIAGGADPKRVHVHPFTSLHAADMLRAGDKPAVQKQYKEKLGVGNRRMALAVGRFIPLKKYDILIRAWKDMPDDCILYLIGGGEERPRYEALIRELGVENIVLTDFLVPEKLSEYFCAADVFVHPSSTETWGLVINEAMAKGCPVIATDRCVAAVELIRDSEEGYLTPVGDTDALHERLLTVLSDGGLRARMSAKAIERITPYTYENLAAAHLRIFAEEA